MKIRIENVPIEIRLGVFPEERQAKQSVTAHITMEIVDPGDSDDLRLTADYSKICAVAHSTFDDEAIYLVETAVQRLGRSLLGAFPVAKSVDIEIIKHHIPDPRLKDCRVSVSASFQRGS